MNICVITRSYDQLMGGLEYATQELCEGLVDEGNEVTVLTSKHPNGITCIGCKESASIKVIRYYAPDGKVGRYSSVFFNFSEQLFNKLNAEKKFDIVHVESTGMTFKPPCPYVVRLHGTNFTEIKTAIKNPTLLTPLQCARHVYYRYKFYDLIHNADNVVAISTALREQIKSEFETDKITLIHNGVNTHLFRPLDKMTAAKTVMYVGRLKPEKGYDTLISVFPMIQHRISDAELHIVGGDGSDTNSGITYLGQKSHEKMPEVYRNADVVALPTRRWEGLSMTVLEAMSCGVPVVTSSYGGKDIITDGKDGYIVDDDERLVDRILDVLENHNLAKTLGSAGRRNVIKNFSVDAMVKKHVQLYESLI